VTTAILETALYCEDLDGARRFYGEKLGLEIIEDAPGRHIFFRLAGSVLLIFNPAATLKSSPGGLPIPNHGTSGAGHACFSTVPLSYEERLKSLRQAGIEIEQEIVWPNGARSVYFRDFEGNSLEFGEPKLWDMG